MSKLTLDEAIKHCLEVTEENDLAAETYEILAENNHNAYERLTAETNSSRCAECAADHRQLAEWLKELKDLREENKVLMQECDRLIKEKGELLSKVSGGDILRICQLEEQLEKELKDLREENKVLTRDCLRLIKSNDKLRKKLKQIAEYKRLLKAAVDDLNATVAEVYNGGVICECCKWESQIGECCCPNDGGCDVAYRWRYADEALKLIES